MRTSPRRKNGEKKGEALLANRTKPLVIEDETTVRVQTTLRRLLAPRGSRPEVVVRTGRYQERVNVFISWLAWQEKVVVTLQHGLAATQTLEHLQAVHEMLDGAAFTVLWDGSGNHKAREVQAWCHARGITVEYFPPHSPQLNPVEEINKQLKDYLANTIFWTVEDLKRAITRFFIEKGYRFTFRLERFIGVPEEEEASCGDAS